MLGLTGVVVAWLALAGQAHAAFGDLSFEQCLTGESASGPPPPPTDTDACADAGTPTANGLSSGLGSMTDIAVSSDGSSVYGLATGDDAVAHFDRDITTGELTFQACLTGNQAVDAASTACTATADATADGIGSGLENPNGLALSPGDAFLYVVSESDDAVAWFDRAAGTGGLTYTAGDCITGDTDVTACAATADAETDGTDSGMDGIQDLAMRGNSLYTASPLDDAVAGFGRQMDGDLTYGDCLSGDSTVTNCGTAGATASGTNSGRDVLRAVAVSPDGDSLYTASDADDAVARFDRGTAGGLTYVNCITGEQATGTDGGNNACTAISTDTLNGINSGLDLLVDVAVSHDDASVYAVTLNDEGVARFDRDSSTGALTYRGCITGESGTTVCDVIANAGTFGSDSGLDGPLQLALTADGKSLYVVASDDSSVAHFERDTGTGALSYENCVTGETETGPAPGGSGACSATPVTTAGGANSGLDQVEGIAVTGDGKTVYTGAFPDSAVSHFNRENPPETILDTGPPATTSDSTPSFTFSTPEATASFECSVDGGTFGACSDSTGPAGDHTTAPLPDGPHSFSVRARDTFGFADATPASSAFTVDAVPDPPAPGPGPPATDTDPPETTVTKQPKKKVETEKKKKNAKFEFTSDEAGSSFECEVDDKGFAPCSSPFKKKVKSDGKHTFEVRAIDPAGNVDSTPSLVKWKLKRT